ncbi:hypothetical protein LXL04_030729 [Taraxacum kok-saghyz]
MFVHFKSLVFELSKLNHTHSRTKSFHALLIKTCLLHDPFYATKIIRFYAINNDVTSACNLFDETPNRTVYLWNSIIRAYAQTHRFHNAFRLFKQMLVSETKPDNFTFACILRACSESFDLEGLKFVHAKAIVSDLGSDSITASALVSAYSKFHLVDDASMVFDRLNKHDLVLLNTMITGYGSCGYWQKALNLFIIMRRFGNQPDGYTIVGLLSGLTCSSLLEIGQGIHGYCLRTGFDSNTHINSVLVSMYARCGCMNSAYKVFNDLSYPDLVTCSALISGFSQSGDYRNALISFKNINSSSKKPDSILLSILLAVASQLVNLTPGVEIHGYAIRHNLQTVMVSSALIDMYSKCGFLEMGLKVFDEMPKSSRNIVSYNSVISGLGLHGLPSVSFGVFQEVLKRGLNPNESTFTALLSACSHGGLVKQGREIFRRMKSDYGIEAKTEHYVHFVKLLGMSGELKEAYEVVESLGENVDCGILGALLSCCDDDLKMGEIVGNRLLECKEEERRSYRIMVSNLLAGNGRWDDVMNLRDEIGDVGKKKVRGVKVSIKQIRCVNGKNRDDCQCYPETKQKRVSWKEIMALVTHQIQGSYAPPRPLSLKRGIESKKFLAAFPIAPQSNRKPLKISSFKGPIQNDESSSSGSGSREKTGSKSKSTKNPVKLSWAPQDRKETRLSESPKVKNNHASNLEETTTAKSQAIQQLFKSWLTLLRTPSSSSNSSSENQVPNGALEAGTCENEIVETGEKVESSGRGGVVLKLVSRSFLSLDAAIKIPAIIFIPMYLAVNMKYGPEVAKELTPLWICGPLLIALYIKIIQGLCLLYIYSFKQSVNMVKNLPVYFDYVYSGKLKETINARFWNPVVEFRKLGFKGIWKNFQEWMMDKYLDYVESIWPNYCKLIRMIIDTIIQTLLVRMSASFQCSSVFASNSIGENSHVIANSNNKWIE